MEYIQHLTRPELLAECARVRNELNALKIKKESTDDEEKQRTLAVVKNLEDTIKVCEDRLKAQSEDQQALKELPITNEQAMIKSLNDSAVKQNLLDIVRTIPKLKTGDPIELFVTSLQQIYMIEVKPLLNAMPTLEGEFCNASKRLLTYPIYTQMCKSGKTTDKWDELQKYLIDTHSIRISNYQHLHRLWNCDLHESEKLSDFGARLEDKVHSASIHIQSSFKAKHMGVEMTTNDVFSLIGAMLSSIQIRHKYPDAYKSIIKTCDQHWTASSLVADAGDYVDKMNLSNDGEQVFHTKIQKPKKIVNSKVSTKKKEDVKKNKRLEDYKKRCSTEICELFLKGKCRYGTKCFRIHPEKSVHYTEQQPEECELGSLFHQGPAKSN